MLPHQSLAMVALAVVVVAGLQVENVTGRTVVKRQTYHYPDELRKYAHTHPGTKIMHGTVGRYAPQEWPAWYTRMIFKWNGESRIAPYHPNDVRYLGYEQNRIANNNNLRRLRIA